MLEKVVADSEIYSDKCGKCTNLSACQYHLSVTAVSPKINSSTRFQYQIDGTESGTEKVAMLSSVLRSDIAIEVNIRIIPNWSLEKASCHFLMAVNRKIGSILFNSCHRLGHAYNAKVMETIITSSKKDSKDTFL